MKKQQDIIEAIAELVQAGVPLAEGLRAAADETTSSRMARTFGALARQIEAGDDLEGALRSTQRRAQPYIVDAVRAGVKTGRLGQVLTELVQLQRFREGIRRSITSSFAYPVLLVIVTVVLMWTISVTVIPSVTQVIRDFEMETSRATEALIWWSEAGSRFVGYALLVIPCLALVVRLVVGAAPWRWFLGTIPVFGCIFQWIGTVELARLLRIFLAQEVPLPAALRLSADGVRDANIAAAAREAAADVESGTPLHRHLGDNFRIPLSLVPFVAWGEKQGRLVEALDLTVEVFEGRVNQRVIWIGTVLPPLIFILIAAMVGATVVGLNLPFIGLIRSLA